MTNQEILKELTKVDTSYGGLSPIQVPDEFIQNLITEDSLLKEIRVVRNIKREFQLMALNVASRQLKKGIENTSPTQEDLGNVNITSRSLIPKEAILPYNISFKWLKQNIASDDGENQLNDEFLKALKNDIVDLAINGDTSTSDTDPDYKFLVILNGLKKRVTDDGDVNLFLRGTSQDWKAVVFPGLYKLLPHCYKTNERELFFVCSYDVFDEYAGQLALRETTLGDTFYSQVPKLYYRGIEIKPVPNCPDGFVVLTPKKNLAIGLGDDFKVYKEDDTRARVRKYTIETYIDFNYAVSRAISYCL